MNEPHQSFFSRIQPWLERLAGVILLYAGGLIIHTGELKTRRVHFQGSMAYVAGATTVLLALLLLRGRIYSAGNGQNRTRFDEVVAALALLGFAICLVVHLYGYFTGQR